MKQTGRLWPSEGGDGGKGELLAASSPEGPDPLLWQHSVTQQSPALLPKAAPGWTSAPKYLSTVKGPTEGELGKTKSRRAWLVEALLGGWGKVGRGR